MAKTPGRQRVTAEVEALCRPFLRISSALGLGCLGILALSLLGIPVAFLLLGEGGFWKLLGSGLAWGIGVTIAAAVVIGFLDDHLTSRTANRFSRRFPLGRERDLAISVLQQRRQEVSGDEVVSMNNLLAKLSVPVPLDSADIEGAPVEAQVAEALETLAAERDEGTPSDRAEPKAEGAPPAPQRLRSTGVIPLEPEGAEGRPSQRPGRRPGKKPRRETAT